MKERQDACRGGAREFQPTWFVVILTLPKMVDGKDL